MRGIANEQFDLMKEHMKHTVDHMQHDTADNCFQVLTSQYEVLKQLYAIDFMKRDFGLIDNVEVDVDIDDVEDNTETLAATLIDVASQAFIEPDITSRYVNQTHAETEVLHTVGDDTRSTYRVERKLSGAYVPDIDGYIPETILRSEGIEHGDYIYAEPIESHEAGQKRFDYRLAHKSQAEPPEDRVEYLYCPVEKDGNILVVKHSSATGEKIRFDESPYAVLLSDIDIERFSLVEGDLVDIAFYRNKPSTVRVYWKHNVPEIHSDVTTERPRKERTKSHSNSHEPTKVEQVFRGMTICIVGDKPNESSYKQLIEERGGTLLHVEPKWNHNRIEHSVKKSDMVIGLYGVSSHTGLEKAKAYCKKHNVPFEMISGRGKTKAIQTAIDLLGATVTV